MTHHTSIFCALSKARYAYILLLTVATLASQAPRQVADINKVKVAECSSPRANRYHRNSYRDDMRFALIGNRAFFSASSKSTGSELYSSSGTPTGGSLVLDINPGIGGSGPTNFTVVGNKIYFAANDGKNGTELWVTDGTKKGTRMVADLYRGPSSSSPAYICPLGNTGRLVFQASTATTQYELYISDGTAAGTKLLKDIYPGSRPGYPYAMKSFNNGQMDLVVFNARTQQNGIELWITNGTTVGTMLVKDIRPGGYSSTPRCFQVLGKSVIFQAINSSGTLDLWITNGLAKGTKLLKNISASTRSGASLYYGVSLLGKYYFEGHDAKAGSECWVTDGTVAGTALFSDASPGVSNGGFKYGAALGTKIVYRGNRIGQGSEPWVLDTITKKAVLLKDLNPGPQDSTPGQFAAIGKRVVFGAYGPSSGSELHITDGTAAGTRLLKDILPGRNSSIPVYFTRLSSKRMLFRARCLGPTWSSSDLWVTDGTATGTLKTPVSWKTAPTVDSNPRYATPLNGRLYFSANDGVTGTELWQTNGQASGTALVADIFPGSSSTGAIHSSTPMYLARVGNQLVFAADDGKGKGRELWRSDGTSAGTSLLKDVFNGAESSSPSHMARIGNKVYFSASGYDGAKPRNFVGRELFVTDGTVAGTRFVADLNLGFLSSSPQGFTEIGNTGRFVFSAFGVENKAPHRYVGYELHVSNGTRAGTRLLKDIVPGLNSSSPSHFAAMGGKVYFSARTQDQGSELWVTDGTVAGTTLVKDINAGRSSSYPRYLQSSGGKLYFQAFGSTAPYYYGTELWESDGTAAGTRVFKDIAPGGYSGRPSFITAVGSRHLWFSAVTGVGSTSRGNELWTSDLTSAGTRLHTDIQPGPSSSSPEGLISDNSRFAVMGSKVYFTATSSTHGRELWLVDNGATATRFGDACKSSHVTGTDPVLGRTAKITGTTKSGFSANVLLLGIRSPTQLPMGGECQLNLNPFGPILIVGTSTGTSYTAALPIPNMPRLQGLKMALQTLHLRNPFPGGSGFSNALEWVVGK